MRKQRLIGAATLAAALLTPGPASAQSWPSRLTYAGEVGPRTYTNALDSMAIGKFEEYRDLRAKSTNSLLLEQLFLKFTPADSFGVYTLSARKLLDRDQSLFLHAARPGEYDFQIRADRIPHTYSTTAHSPGDELSTPGFNTLPTVRPDSFAWRSGAYIDRIRSQWDPLKATLAAMPTRNLDFKAEYTRIAKSGGTPRSISYSGSSGPQREYISPIKQTVNDVRVSQDYTSGPRRAGSRFPFIKSYQTSASYAISRFSNDIKSTMVDNPQLSTSSFTSGTASARVSLEPDNSAQTVGAVGAVGLPWRSRVTGSVMSSWMSQNDAFFPQTSNDTLARDPNYGLVDPLPRASLEGKARTMTWLVSAISHPVKNVTLSARHRSFDLSNQTPAMKIQAMVVSDRTIALADSETFEPHPYTRTTTNIGARYELRRGVGASIGYAWEGWTRDPAIRNREETTEKTPSVSVDASPWEWVTLRASYASGRKRGSTYTEAATEILDFRRFDEADRNRTRTTVIGTFTPLDPVTLTLTYQAGNDKFPNSLYGIQEDISRMTSVDVDWMPLERLSLSAGWTYEDVKDSANYRYRTGAVGSVTYDNATYRWMNTNKDLNVTYYVAGNVTIIPDKLDLIGTWSVNRSNWRMYNTNVTTPTGGTAAQNLNATAQDWPLVTMRLEPVSISARYQLREDWSVGVRFQRENYDQVDFRTTSPSFTSNSLNTGTVNTNYAPGELPGTIGQVAGSNTGQYHFLGNNYRPYDVSWLTFTVSYRPSLLQWSRGRSGL